MERTLLHHCTLLRPEALSVQADGLVVFAHASTVDPPDCIGYAGPRCGPGAPSMTPVSYTHLKNAQPPLVEVEPGHCSRCHKYTDAWKEA